MLIAPFQPQSSAAGLPLESLADNPSLSEPQKVAEASRQFEAILLRQILQGACQNVLPHKEGSLTAINGIYQDLLTYHLADQISRSGGIGLTEALCRQMQGTVAPSPDSPLSAGPPSKSN